MIFILKQRQLKNFLNESYHGIKGTDTYETNTTETCHY